MDDATGPPEPVDKPASTMTVEELGQAVRYHNWRYFTLSDPAIDDYEFDALNRLLRDRAPDHPALGELVSDVASGDKVAHDTPMLSLDKCYDAATMERWASSFEGDVIETPKIDGVAASLRYDAAGRLVAAVTRGDGKVGEAFTPNARHIADIPHQLTGPPIDGPVEVRGEIYMRLTVFETLSDQFSNPRNTTAGAIKQKHAAKTADYRLSFFAYDVQGVDLATEMDKVTWSQEHGLCPVETRLVDKASIQEGYDRWVTRREHVDFELDGVVYKANQVVEHARLGSTAHHPRWAIAYKFQGDAGASVLRGVEWSVSRTGTITPVALIEPVELSGAMVSRCSLHNLSQIRDLDLREGAGIVAMRRGGVIPHVEAVTTPGGDPISIPDRCPSCGGPTVVKRNEHTRGGKVVRVIQVLACASPSACPAAVRGTLEHFARIVDIDGFGPKMVDKLMEAGLLANVADLYRLEAKDLVRLESVGDVLANKLAGSVRARRELGLATFLAGLGIDGLGLVTAERLAEHFGNLDRILALTTEDLASLDGFQETLARTIVEGLGAQLPVVDALRGVVTILDHPGLGQEIDPSDPIAGRSFVFTGAMATLDRKSAQARVRERGGKTPSSVTRDLDYLVVGDKGSALLGAGAMSTKHRTAHKNVEGGAPIRIVTETEFLALLDGESTDEPSQQELL